MFNRKVKQSDVDTLKRDMKLLEEKIKYISRALHTLQQQRKSLPWYKRLFR